MAIQVIFSDVPKGETQLRTWKGPVVQVDARLEVRKDLQPSVARLAGKIGKQSCWILGCLSSMRENEKSLAANLEKNGRLAKRKFENTELEGKYARIMENAERMAVILESLSPHELKELYQQHKDSAGNGALAELYEKRPGSVKLERIVDELLAASGDLYIMSVETDKQALAGKIQKLVHVLKHMCRLSIQLETGNVAGFFSYYDSLKRKRSESDTANKIAEDSDIGYVRWSLKWRMAMEQD